MKKMRSYNHRWELCRNDDRVHDASDRTRADGSLARYLIDLGAESQPRPFPSTVENATAWRNSRDTQWDRLRSAGDAPRGIGMRSSENHDPSVSSVTGLSWSTDALLFARCYSSDIDRADSLNIFKWKLVKNVIFFI